MQSDKKSNYGAEFEQEVGPHILWVAFHGILAAFQVIPFTFLKSLQLKKF